MKGVRECDNVGATGGLAGEFQCRLDRIGAGRTRELNDIVEFPRLKNYFRHCQQEALLGHGLKIKTMGNPIILNIIEQGALDYGLLWP